MRSLIFTFCIAFSMSSLTAQQITVRENLEKIDDGINNALVVDIPEANKDVVSRAWRKLMNGAGAKVSGRTDIEAENVKIPLITTDTLWIFTSLDQKDGYVRLVSGFRIKNTFLSSTNNPSAYREAERIVQNFALDQAKNAVQEKVDNEKKKLSRLQKDFNDLDEENAQLSKDIENYNNRIKKATTTISENEKKKESTAKDIEKQKKIVDEIVRKLLDIK